MFNPRTVGEEADAMITQLNQLANESGDQPAGDEPAIAASVDEGAAVEVESDPADAGSEPIETVSPQPADLEQEPTQPIDLQAELEQLKADLKTADSRWKAAQGMITKKDSELDQLRSIMATLVDQANTPAAEESTDSLGAEPPPNSVTSEDISEYGQELYGFVQRVATDVANQQLSLFAERADAKFADLSGKLTGAAEHSATTAQALFEERLTALVSDWGTLNVDEGFLEWLGVEDEFAGRSRRDLLVDAYEALDAPRVAKFFTRYKGEIAPQAATEQAAPSAPKSGSKVAHLVTPGKGKASAPTSTSDDGRIWTRADIAKLYDDKMSGRIDGETFAAAERDLFQAQRQNRIAE